MISSITVFAVVALVTALLPSRSDRDVTEEDFDRLEPGMTRAEVEHLLRGPPRNNLRYPAIIWLPQATGRPISHEIAPTSPAIELFSHEDRPKNGRPAATNISALDFFPQETAKDGRQAVWVTRAGLIAVEFGRDGRLRHKYTSMVDEPGPPSVFDRQAPRPKVARRRSWASK